MPPTTCPATVAAAATASSTRVHRRVSVELVADIVCPWCYIGLRRLQNAATQAAERGIAVELTYTPFILRRHLPKTGIDKIEMFSSQGMGEAGARSKFEHIRQTAATDGLCLDFESQRAGNSEDAHRLLLWAAGAHGATWLALMDQMFEQYSCRRGWLGSPDVLMAAVEGAGRLPAAEAAGVLADEAAYLEDLEAGLKRSAKLAAQGVPLFVVDGAASLPGAVPAPELLHAVVAAAQTPRRLAQWYVESANVHDLVGLAGMLAADVDMFGGPCDLAGLESFFATYPQIHWRVTSEYAPLPSDEATVVLAYTRTWRGPQGQRLAVDAEEAIAFNSEGKVARIYYTRGPSEAREAEQ